MLDMIRIGFFLVLCIWFFNIAWGVLVMVAGLIFTVVAKIIDGIISFFKE